jgi:hypothetical protein
MQSNAQTTTGAISMGAGALLLVPPQAFVQSGIRVVVHAKLGIAQDKKQGNIRNLIHVASRSLDEDE